MYIPFWSHSKKRTFCLDHIPKRGHSVWITFQKEHISNKKLKPDKCSLFSYEKLQLKCFIFCSISWTVAIRTEMSTYLFLTFSPCCAGNVPLSFFLSKMKQAEKEAIHRSISLIIQIHLSTVRSNIVVYILPKVSKGIVRLFCFWNVLFFVIFSFWNVLI